MNSAAVAVLDQGMDLAGDKVDAGQQADRAVALVLKLAREARVQDTAKSEAIASNLSSRIVGLGQRERQIMDGLVTGLSNKLAARQYDISLRTIEVYRGNGLTKMQARNLSELVRVALHAGIPRPSAT